MSTTLRVLSFNVRSLRDDGDAVVAVIRAARPHVVCIQEAPRFLRWRSRCAALARRSGLVVITGGRTAAGNLLLADLAVEVTHHQDLLLSHRVRTHRRGAAVAVCSLAGHRFGLVGTHLDLYAEDRRGHARELLDALPAAGLGPDLPVVLGGDINETPGSPAWSILAAAFSDVAAALDADPQPTSTATDPRRRIDGIFADRRLVVRSVSVPGSDEVLRASDHRPVVAELDLD
ncbi:MAG: endonuclease/exonuclease/phosphatase family protein [Mycobacteriales bacterium]